MIYTVPGWLVVLADTKNFCAKGRTRDAKENSVDLFHPRDPERILRTGNTRVPCVGKSATLALSLKASASFNTRVQLLEQPGPDPCCIATQSCEANGPVVSLNLLYVHFESPSIAFIPTQLKPVDYQSDMHQNVLICRFIGFVQQLAYSCTGKTPILVSM